jgi:hypothetical protein
MQRHHSLPPTLKRDRNEKRQRSAIDLGVCVCVFLPLWQLTLLTRYLLQ